MSCADIGCNSPDVVGRAEAIRDAYAALADEIHTGIVDSTLSERDGLRIMSLIRETRGWLNAIERQLS